MANRMGVPPRTSDRGGHVPCGPRARIALRDWARPPYDVVWFSTARSYEWTGRPDLGPTIVDLDNLEDVKCRLRAELLADQLRSPGVRGSLRSRLALFQVRLNGRDWHRFQRSVAAQVDQVVIASELDAARSGLSNVTVIPNTYPRPPAPVGNPAADKAPVLLFQGNLSYPPNIDAAQWLARDIAPLIQAAVPSTEVRLVGRPGENVSALHQPGVLSVVGEVPTMDHELARAAVAVVPIRYRSGTRVKILESFAHASRWCPPPWAPKGSRSKTAYTCWWPTSQRRSPRPPCASWVTPNCAND